MNHNLDTSSTTAKEELLSESSEKILHFLSRATSELGNSLSWDESLQQIAQVVVPDLAESCSVWWLDQDDHLVEKLNTHQKINYYNAAPPEITEVVKTGISILQKMDANGSFLAAPMRIRNKIVGVLVCFSSSRIFTQTDLVITEEISFRGAMALDNAKMFQELKRNEEYLQKSRQIAEVENQAKSLFLANMSHEIRTPLTAILGFLDLILAENEQGTGRSAKRSADLSERVRANGAHLLKLIDQILDLSKIESGKIEIFKEAVNLNDLLKEIYDTMGLQSKKRSNSLEFRFDSSIPTMIQTDPTRLKQILINIIGNALKFTENGAVAVTISYDEPTSMLSFVVEDNGIGLTEEQMQKIFNPFIQGDVSHTKRFGGTGLGLSLSRRFAQHMNGDIVLLSSEPTRGTVFKVTVQAEDVSHQKIDPAQWQESSVRPVLVAGRNDLSLSGVKILLAEDSPDNQLIINMILEKVGAQVDIASDGAEAFSKAVKNKYDVILLDIQLPVMNGHEVCQKLRAQGYTGPVIALTAHALKKERDQSLQIGCDAHLTKPIDRYHLISTIQSYVQMKMDFPH